MGSLASGDEPVELPLCRRFAPALSRERGYKLYLKARAVTFHIHTSLSGRIFRASTTPISSTAILALSRGVRPAARCWRWHCRYLFIRCRDAQAPCLAGIRECHWPHLRSLPLALLLLRSEKWWAAYGRAAGCRPGWMISNCTGSGTLLLRIGSSGWDNRMTSPPAISVVIPAYNQPESLRAALDALAAQTLPKSQFEVIVVDDGSPTTLADVCAAAQGKLNLQYVRVENGGPGRARDIGAARSRGEYVAFTDHDCRPVPTWLAAYASAFEDEFPPIVRRPHDQWPDRQHIQRSS